MSKPGRPAGRPFGRAQYKEKQMSYRTTRSLAALAVTAVAAGSTLAGGPAQASSLDDRSLATVLAADGNHLDRNWDDFDILDKAVHAVLAADPGSPVAVLADGDTRLTAFLPTDRAFRRLVFTLTGKRPATERATLRAVTSVADAPTLEKILLYHVVPGQPITYRQARMADDARLGTALRPKIRVNVIRHRVVKLQDRDFDNANARVLRSLKDINRGNKQIAHGINQVLRPIDL
jgi:uncharacterized surface protein with fasciclin (FAS1) repeats